MGMNSAYPGLTDPHNVEVGKHSPETPKSFIWIGPGRQEKSGNSS